MHRRQRLRWEGRIVQTDTTLAICFSSTTPSRLPMNGWILMVPSSLSLLLSLHGSPSILSRLNERGQTAMPSHSLSPRSLPASMVQSLSTTFPLQWFHAAQNRSGLEHAGDTAADPTGLDRRAAEGTRAPRCFLFFPVREMGVLLFSRAPKGERNLFSSAAFSICLFSHCSFLSSAQNLEAITLSRWKGKMLSRRPLSR